MAQQFDEIFRVLAERTDPEGYTRLDEADVDLWATGHSLFWPRFLDAFAAELALRYAAGRVNFAFSGSAVNDLWAVLISRFEQVDEGEWPKLFSEVFEAFDAGEFRRPGDADPVALYTDPAIAEIIAKLG